MAPISRFPKGSSTCSTRQKESSTPPEQRGLTPYIIIVMRLTILVDVIAIAAGIAVILVAADNRASDAAEDCTDRCAGTGADARKHRAGESARARAYDGTGCGAGDRMIGSGCTGAAAESEAACDGGGN